MTWHLWAFFLIVGLLFGAYFCEGYWGGQGWFPLLAILMAGLCGYGAGQFLRWLQVVVIALLGKQ